MEKKTFVIHPTPYYAAIENLPFLLAVPAGSLASVLLPAFSAVFLAAAGGCFLVGLYRYVYTRKIAYALSDSHLTYSRGLLSLTTDYLELYRVKDITVNEPLPLRLIGAMNIVVESSDKTHPVLVLQGIPQSNLAETLRQVVERSRRLNRVYEVD